MKTSASNFKVRPVFMVAAFVVLAAIAVAVFGPRFFKVPLNVARYTDTTINALQTALGHFNDDHGRFPSNEEGLEALVVRPATMPEKTWRGPYISQVPGLPRRQRLEYGSPGPAGEPYILVVQKSNSQVRQVFGPPVNS